MEWEEMDTATKEKIMSKIRKVLIKQVGDSRECPCCRNSFIPDDHTSKVALELYQELFKE